MQHKHTSHTKARISGDLMVSFSQMSTTVCLSQLKSIFWCHHRMSHVCIAARMACSSFHVIFVSCCSNDQQSQSHLPIQYPPYPSFLKVSVNNCIVEFSVQWESSIKIIPDQWGRKVNHHYKSSWVSIIRCMWWCNYFTVILKFISLVKELL